MIWHIRLAAATFLGRPPQCYRHFVPMTFVRAPSAAVPLRCAPPLTVSRAVMRSERHEMDCVMDFNVDVYPIDNGMRLVVAWAKTIDLDGVSRLPGPCGGVSGQGMRRTGGGSVRPSPAAGFGVPSSGGGRGLCAIPCPTPPSVCVPAHLVHVTMYAGQGQGSF